MSNENIVFEVNEKVLDKITKENKKKAKLYKQLSEEELEELKRKAKEIVNNFECFLEGQLQQGIDPWYYDSEKNIVIYEKTVCKRYNEENMLFSFLRDAFYAKFENLLNVCCFSLLDKQIYYVRNSFLSWRRNNKNQNRVLKESQKPIVNLYYSVYNRTAKIDPPEPSFEEQETRNNKIRFAAEQIFENFQRVFLSKTKTKIVGKYQESYVENGVLVCDFINDVLKLLNKNSKKNKVRFYKANYRKNEKPGIGIIEYTIDHIY